MFAYVRTMYDNEQFQNHLKKYLPDYQLITIVVPILA
jgi:hypothetical protein